MVQRTQAGSYIGSKKPTLLNRVLKRPADHACGWTGRELRHDLQSTFLHWVVAAPKPTDVAAAHRAARCRVPLVKECRSCGLAHVQ